MELHHISPPYKEPLLYRCSQKGELWTITTGRDLHRSSLESPTKVVHSRVIIPRECLASHLIIKKSSIILKRIMLPFQHEKLKDIHNLLSVGVPRFERGTPCSQSRCANRTALHPETFKRHKGTHYISICNPIAPRKTPRGRCCKREK